MGYRDQEVHVVVGMEDVEDIILANMWLKGRMCLKDNGDYKASGDWL